MAVESDEDRGPVDRADAVGVLIDLHGEEERFVAEQALGQFALTQRGLAADRQDDERLGLAATAEALGRRIEQAFAAGDDDESAEAGEGVDRRRGGRRRNDPEGPRANRVVIKLSDRELAEITALARAMSCSPQRVYTSAVASAGAVFGRMALLRQTGVLADLYGATRLLSAVGNNLNQLTRAANATGEIAEGIDRTLEAVDSVVMRITVILDEADLQ